MISKDKVIEYLGEYQDDLGKIIGKHRRDSHCLSVNEIISEVNNYIISKPETFSEREDINTQAEFNKLCYSITRNFIKWTAKGAKSRDQKYHNNRVDYTVYDDDDGEMSAFEYICRTIGDDDPEFKKLNESQKYNNILKWILDYSHFLTSRQKNILPYMIAGKTMDEIAVPLNVTHQAVSHLMRDAFEKIKGYVKIELTADDDKKVINQGRKSINFLYGDIRKKCRRIPKKRVT